MTELTAAAKAHNLGFNSYRIDAAEPRSPFFTDSLTEQYNAGWRAAKRYQDKQARMLRSSNF